MIALLFRLPWPRRRPPRAAMLRVDPVMADELGAPAEEPVLGCGWFDSSWELRRGLAVTEHRGFDRVQSELPLSWLLQ